MSQIENNRTSSDCSFLQVTINSEKLTGMLEQIMKHIHVQTHETEEIRDSITILKKSFHTAIEESEGKMGIELEKFRKINTEQLHRNKLFLEEIDKNLQKRYIFIERKIKQREMDINKLYQKNQDFQQTLNELENNHLYLQQKHNEEIEALKEKIVKLEEIQEQSNEKFDRQVEMVLLKVQSLISESSSGFRISIPKEKKKTQKMSPTMSANLAQFSQKLDDIQKRFQQERTPLLNNVLYARKNDENSVKIEQKEKQNKENKKNSKEQIKLKTKKNSSKKQLEDNMSKKVFDDFQFMMNEKIGDVLKELNKFKNKMVVLDEKVGIQGRKLDKQHHHTSELKNKLMKFEDKKSDDQILQVMRNQMKKNVLQLGQELEKKMVSEDFDREKLKIYEKLSIIHENIAQKADKTQIKKAFMFIQDKIKQIILLVANEQIQDKDGALKKIPIKCLSCDKGLQSVMVSPRKPMTARDVGAKGIASRIRKKIRHQNSQIQNQSDRS